MAKALVKVCKNGTKVWEEVVPCDRCDGLGGAAQWRLTGVTCYKCHGTGKVILRTMEFTPEHEAELEAKRISKAQKQSEDIARREAKAEAERMETERIIKEREEERKAKKSISEFVGEIGQRILIEVTSVESFEFETQWGSSTCYSLRDRNGNLFKWFTKSAINKGHWDKEGRWVDEELPDEFTIKAIVKEHSEYKGEKQTVLKNVKVI